MRGHIRPYGNRWAVVIYLGKEWNKEKKKYIKKYKWAYEDTEEEAEKTLTRLLHQLDTNQYANPGKKTVSEFIDDPWWPEFSKKLKDTTQDTYTIYIKNHIKPVIGLIQWRNLRPFHIENIFNVMKEKGLAGSTQQYVYAILKDIIHGAMMYTLITKESNPMDLVDRPKAGKTEKRKAWASKYVNRCLEFVSDTPMESAILLAITTGMRRGEIAGLQWADIDWDTNEINVRNGYYRTKKGLTLDEPKSEHSEEVVMLLPPVRDHLNKLLMEQKKNMVKLGAAYVKKITLRNRKKTETMKNDFVHTWEDGTPIAPDYYSKRFCKVCNQIRKEIVAEAAKQKKEIKLEDAFPQILLHELRHSLGSWAADANIPISTIKDILRHGDIKTTQGYVHPDIKKRRRAVSKAVKKVVDKSAKKSSDL